MKMKCPHCGVSGSADRSLFGQKVKCPKCTNIFLVPELLTEAVSAQETTESPREDQITEPESEAALPLDDEVEQVDELAGQEKEVAIDPVEEPASFEDDFDQEPSPTETLDEFSDLAQEDEIAEESVAEEALDIFSDEEEVTDSAEDEDLEEDDNEDISEEMDLLFSDDSEEVVEETDAEEVDLFADELEDGEADEDTELSDTSESEDIDLFADDSESLPETDHDEALSEALEEDSSGEEEAVEVIDETEEDSEDLSMFLDDIEDTEDDRGEPAETVAENVEEELQAELDMMLVGTAESETSGSESTAETVSELTEKVKEKTPKKSIPDYTPLKEFTVGGVLKEAWVLVKGVKSSIWVGMIAMFIVLFGLAAAAVFTLPPAGAPAGSTVAAWVNILIVLFGTILSMSFLAGLINIGVRRVQGRPFSWKLIFSGFSQLSKVVLAGFLMTILITSGFFLLVLPGIYLAVGYSLTFPLIFTRDLGPWDAMELSRKTIHKHWFKVFGIYLVMYLIYLASTIPLGLGAIWTIPMFFTLTGVLYRVLFSDEVEE